MSVVALGGTLPGMRYPRLQISGNSTLGYSLNHVTGSQGNFKDDNPNHDTPWSFNSSLFLDGDLMRNLKANATLSTGPFQPDSSRWYLQYNADNSKVTVGDFGANLTGNDFVFLNRTLRGMQVDQNIGKGKLTAVTSALKAPVKTDTFYGQNVSGPYYLSSSPIVNESEVVLVNGVQQTRGTQYWVDYLNGILNFAPSIIIAPAMQVTVSYEVGGGGLAGGQLYALRGTYPLNGSVNVGVSHVTVKGRGTGSTERIERDKFTGDGTPGPVYLTYRPIVEGSDTVAVNFVQRPKGSYTLNYATGELTFHNLPGENAPLPPAGANIVVDYRVAVPGQPADDRAVTGVDIAWQGRHGIGVTVQAATSGNTGGATGQQPQTITNELHRLERTVPLTQQTFYLQHAPLRQGSVTMYLGNAILRDDGAVDPGFTIDYQTGVVTFTNDALAENLTILDSNARVSYVTQPAPAGNDGNAAFSVLAKANQGRLAAQASYRHLDSGFSPLETVGYRNTQRALAWQLGYALNDRLRFTTTGDNTRLPINPYAGSAATNTGLTDEYNRTFALEYTAKSGPTVSLNRSTRDSIHAADARLGTGNTEDRLVVSWDNAAPGLSATLNANRLQSENRTLRASDGGVNNLTSANASASLTLNYAPSERVNLTAVTAANEVVPNGDRTRRTSGTTAQVNGSFKATRTLTFTAGLQAVATGATRDLQGGLVNAQETRNATLGTEWRFAKNVSVNLNYALDRTDGTSYYDTRSNTWSSNLWWQVTPVLTINAYGSRQNLQNQSDANRSLNNMVGMGAEYRGFGKAVVNLDGLFNWGMTTMTTAVDAGGDTTTVGVNTRLTTVSGKVSYPIAQRQDLFVSTDLSHSNGFGANSLRSNYTFGWNYHITDHAIFTLGAGRTAYRDQLNKSLDYTADTLDAKVSWQF